MNMNMNMNMNKLSSTIATSIYRPALFNGSRGQGFQGDKKRIQLSGSEFYAASLPGDRVQLHHALQEILPLAQAHLERVTGRTFGHIEWTQDPIPLNEREAYIPCMYNDEDAPNNIRYKSEYIRWNETTKRYATKNGFIAFCEEYGFQHLLPKTIRFKAGEKLNIDALPNHLWIKRNYETTGSVNVMPFSRSSTASLQEVYDFVGNHPYQIQEHIPGEDYSISYCVTQDGQAVRFTTVDMIVENNHHAASRFPSTGGLIKIVDEIDHLIQTVADLGFRGLIGVDLRGENNSYYAIEWNMRLSGSHIPYLLANELGHEKGFYRREVKVNPLLSPQEVYDRLHASGLEYNSKTRQGAIAYLWGWLQSEHSIGILALADNPEALCQSVEKILIA
jgi:ATP-grasp domain